MDNVNPQDPMSVEALVQALMQAGQLPPEFIDSMGGLVTLPDERAMMMRQANQGAGMMQTPGATGQNVAGTYVAANPVEHLSVALQRIMGGQMQKGAEQKIQDTFPREQEGVKAYYGQMQMGPEKIQALLDQYRKSQQMAPATPTPTYGPGF